MLNSINSLKFNSNFTALELQWKMERKKYADLGLLKNDNNRDLGASQCIPEYSPIVSGEKTVIYISTNWVCRSADSYWLYKKS